MCLVALASHAAAQTVRGVVAEDGTGTRLAGAMVVLFDFDGEAVDRVLSDAGGGFTMRADHPGRYHVRVDRIGYASLTTDPFDVPVRGTFRRIDVPIRPIRLRGLDVSGSRRCEVRPEEGRVTARVWEEARKALEATAWTQSTGIYRYTLLHFVRDLDRSCSQSLEAPPAKHLVSGHSGRKGAVRRSRPRPMRGGIFLLCDVPHGSTLRLDATRSDGASASRRALVPRGAEVAILLATIQDRR